VVNLAFTQEVVYGRGGGGAVGAIATALGGSNRFISVSGTVDARLVANPIGFQPPELQNLIPNQHLGSRMADI
jgi:hypothetical protein